MALPFFRMAPRRLAPFRVSFRCESTSAAPANSNPILSTLREDLKSAMRAKESTRLAVIRALIADVAVSAHDTKPITKAFQLLPVLRKKVDAGQKAIEEFTAANRNDLAEKETGQIKVLQYYISKIKAPMTGETQIQQAIDEAIANLRSSNQKVAVGPIMKEVTEKLGKDENVEKAEAIQLIQKAMMKEEKAASS